MKELRIFYLKNCPYCRRAEKALAELVKEKQEYRSITVDWVEESQQADLANQYDYYYVPSIFAGREKRYEASPLEDFAAIKENIRTALDAAMCR